MRQSLLKITEVGSSKQCFRQRTLLDGVGNRLCEPDTHLSLTRFHKGLFREGSHFKLGSLSDMYIQE